MQLPTTNSATFRNRQARVPSLLVGLFLAPGCHQSAPNPAPRLHTSPPANSVQVPTATPVASPAVSAVSAAATEPRPQEDDAEFDQLAGTIDSDGPPAPCDFSRHYRGTVGKSPWSVNLSRNGSSLQGLAAYDAGVGEIALRGTVRPDESITLEESKDGQSGGRIEGQCAKESGIISGTWKQGAHSKPFVLKPRSPTGVAIFERRRRIGPPEEESPSCEWDVRSPAVFGIGDAERAARVNAHLQVHFGGLDETDAERRVTRCQPGADNHVRGWYSIEANEQGLLSVVENGYVYLGPAAHGDFSAAIAATSIDIPSGRKLALKDIVTSSKALRPVVTSCMKLVSEAFDGADEWWFERNIQGVPTNKEGESVEETSPDFVASSLKEPSFLVLPDGIAVLIRGQPTVTAFSELQGPVIQWGALLRASVLKANSPIARLWAHAQPIAPNVPSCVRFFKPKWTTPLKAKK